MNTKQEEEVNGVVVGPYSLACSLFYEGRKQGKTIFASTEDEARQIAECLKTDITLRCGNAARDIFPLNAWELRIHGVS